MQTNLILATDSYKFSHFLQYPPGTEKIYSYVESRGGKYDACIFFGLQYALIEYLAKGVTVDDVEEAAAFAAAHGEPFPLEGWMYIATELGGKLPIRIRAVPEGTLVPNHNIMVSVESTDPKVPWIASWVETLILRAIWYPTTVATQSHSIKQVIRQYLERTADNTDGLMFKLHDFGARGVSSAESAGIGGAAHLVNFMGSDTVEGVVLANRYYESGMAGFSIPAAEHSSITSWGREHEVDAYRNMLTQFARPGSLVAVVSDSYDIYNAITNLWGSELHDEVVASGATLVIRPDSGHPATVVLECLKLLDAKFGSVVNSKGYKVLNHVRVIQGDGINQNSIEEILMVAKAAGFSADNIAFGMGGALLQQVNRDTQKFAYKCSLAIVNGREVEVWKDPVTDPGKRSKKGYLDLTSADGGLSTYQRIDGVYHYPSAMVTVFEDGVVTKTWTLDEVRARAAE